MSQKTLKARFAQKNDTYENWGQATTFVPMPGEFILVNNAECPIAIGDGTTTADQLRDQTLFKLITTEQIDSLFDGTSDTSYDGEVIIS